MIDYYDISGCYILRHLVHHLADDPELVRRRDQEARRQRLLLPHVRVACSS
jgi:hypothetical protein